MKRDYTFRMLRVGKYHGSVSYRGSTPMYRLFLLESKLFIQSKLQRRNDSGKDFAHSADDDVDSDNPYLPEIKEGITLADSGDMFYNSRVSSLVIFERRRNEKHFKIYA